MEIVPRERRIEQLLARRFEWTDRQREVLDLVARGKSNAEIADALGISLDGAKWHMREILSKLGVDSREEAGEYWRRHNGLPERLKRLSHFFAAPMGWIAVTGASAAGVAIVLIGLWAAADRADSSRPQTNESPSPVPTQTQPPAQRPGLPAPGQELSLSHTNAPTSGVFLLDWAGLGEPGQLRPLDAITGADQPGFDSADMGHAARFYPSPDGKTVAVLRHPTQDQASELYLLDPTRWSISSVRALTGWWNPIWSPDGRYLYRVGSGVGDRSIQRLDPSTGAMTTLGELGKWWPLASEFAPSSERIYVLGMNSSEPGANVLDGDPFLAVIDPDDGREVTRVALPGLIVGQRKETDGERSWYGQYSADLAVSPDGERVYIPHPDSELLTIVDTASMQVERTVSLRPGRSRWAKALGGVKDWFVTSVRAKGGPSFRVQAELSADGRLLYLASAHDVGCRGPGDCEEGQPDGLRVIDTQRLEVVYRAPGVSAFALSSDGAFLVAWAQSWWGPEVTAGGYYLRHGDGVKVIDARQPKALAHLAAGQVVEKAAVSGSGEVFVATPGPGLEEAMQNQGACTQTCYDLLVFEARNGAMTGKRPISSAIFELLTLAP